MSGKNQFKNAINWQSTNPITTFLPDNQPGGSIPSGVINGAMASTNVIYSQIINLAKMDNSGVEINYNYSSGSATGIIEVVGSNSGIYFYPLTFNPALAQPAGSQGGYLINLNQYPYTWFMLRYTNSSGTGVLTAYYQFKDLN